MRILLLTFCITAAMGQGDLLYNGIIFREVPEIDIRLPTFYTTAGASSIQVSPTFLCGQSAVAWCWGRMPRPTFRKEDDYQFIRGVGIEIDYDIFEGLKSPDPAKPRAVYFAGELNFKLRPGSKAVDTGVPLPNVNDGFAGKAPDLGAYETGQPAPVYGPRKMGE